MDSDSGTIFAPVSGPGRAAVGILRVSGPGSALVARQLSGHLPEPRRATLASVRDPADCRLIDQALIIFFPAPRSFTGEDILEIHHHGGHAVANALMEVLGRLPGMRPAEPGEFSKRAFLNGKLDLTQAEALADLIEATTVAQANAALRQMSGAQGRLYAEWRERLLHALAMLEAEIDFAAEEEVPEQLWASLAPTLGEVRNAIRAHLDDGGKGERLRHGLVVAVVGAPNVGKSSLVNALSRREVAIVTPVPGTTRDIIEVALEVEGMPMTLLDTAGLRDSDDPVEREGIARARARAATADLRLCVVDRPGDIAGIGSAAPSIRVLNKADLWPSEEHCHGAVAVSALTGGGVDDLLRELSRAAHLLLPGEDAVLVTRSRHRTALVDAAEALDRAAALGDAQDLGLRAEELRLAARAIGRITGAFGVEDILDRVFGSFCIGK